MCFGCHTSQFLHRATMTGMQMRWHNHSNLIHSIDLEQNRCIQNSELCCVELYADESAIFVGYNRVSHQRPNQQYFIDPFKHIYLLRNEKKSHTHTHYIFWRTTNALQWMNFELSFILFLFAMHKIRDKIECRIVCNPLRMNIASGIKLFPLFGL